MTLKPELWGHMRNLEQGHAGVASTTPASRGYLPGRSQNSQLAKYGLATGAEKVEQERGTGLRLDARDDLDTVIEPPVTEQVMHTADSSGLFVPCAEHHPRDAGIQDGAGAHYAGLEGDDEGGILKVPVVDCGGGGPDREHLGVRGRVVQLLTLVAPNTQHAAICRVDDRRDGNVTGVEGTACLDDGVAHPLVVALHGPPFG
jgi:hypothetical protein